MENGEWKNGEWLMEEWRMVRRKWRYKLTAEGERPGEDNE